MIMKHPTMMLQIRNTMSRLIIMKYCFLFSKDDGCVETSIRVAGKKSSQGSWAVPQKKKEIRNETNDDALGGFWIMCYDFLLSS
jgi:hypothetical protein